MTVTSRWMISLLLALALQISCAVEGHHREDLVGDPFPEAQAELREVVRTIADDAKTANLDGLRAIHLESDKFTKFGPRSFDRQDVASTNRSEVAFWGSASVVDYETRDLKIDVFGDVGIVTYYPHVTFMRDGVERQASGRQTLVFLRTAHGWRIVHEHGTAKCPCATGADRQLAALQPGPPGSGPPDP